MTNHYYLMTFFAIASQCVFSGCPAVLEARGIMEMIGIYQYDDEEICGEQYAYRHAKPKQVKQTTKEVKPANLFTVFPNPTNQTINISYQSTSVDKPTFHIIDLMGQEKFVNLIAIGKGLWQINVCSLANGLYLVALKENGIIKSNQRICVIH